MSAAVRCKEGAIFVLRPSGWIVLGLVEGDAVGPHERPDPYRQQIARLTCGQ